MTQRNEMRSAHYSPDKGEAVAGPFALGVGVPLNRERQLVLANALRRPAKKTPPGGSLKTQEKSSASAQAEVAIKNDETSNESWNNFRRFCELAQKNNLYGVALTDVEQKTWDAARAVAMRITSLPPSPS